jgi:hypothetical protein
MVSTEPRTTRENMALEAKYCLPVKHNPYLGPGRKSNQVDTVSPYRSEHGIRAEP